MTEKVKAIPNGFHTLTPHLVIRDCAKAVEFYKQAFGAEVLGLMYTLDGKHVLHGALKIGDSMMMVVDEFPEQKALSPQSIGGSSVTIHIYVEDVDAAFQRAVTAGCTVTMPLMNAFWGDRYGQLTDPYGHCWSLATHKEDLSPEEIRDRACAAMSKM